MKGKLKSNRVLLVLALILIICFALIGVALFKYFYSGDNVTKYGDRLERSENYKVSDKLESDIKALYNENEVDKVTLKVSGRIIYLTINISEVKKLEDAKSLALKALNSFSEKEKQYYDIQFIITCEKEESSSVESSLYPTMGYKNSTSSIVSWIKD